MKNTDISTLFKPLAKIFRKFHMTIFIVCITAGLGFAVLTFNTFLTESSQDTTYTSPIGAGSIDQTTLERIKSLHTSSEATPELVAPGGRINPFSE